MWMRGAMVALILSACGATVGREIHFEDTKKLIVGVSTRADAEAIFGPPMYMSATGDVTYLSWVYGHTGYGGTNAGSVSLALTFGPDGKYRGVANTSATGTEIPPPAASPVDGGQ